MASGTETAPAAGPIGVLRRRSWRSRTREVRFALLLLIPSIIVVFGIVDYPILRTLYTSFYDVNSPFPGEYTFVGVDNYTHALGIFDFWSAVELTGYFTIVSTFLEVTLGLGIALLLNARLRARWLFRSIVVLPWALPTIVNGALWRYMFNAQYGVVNAALTQLHVIGSSQAWFSKPFLSLNLVF